MHTKAYSPGGACQLSPALQRWEKRKTMSRVPERRDDQVLTRTLQPLRAGQHALRIIDENSFLD
jgi:hypothetical protein